MPRPFDDHEPQCRRELRGRHFRPDDPRIDEECRCNARYLVLPRQYGGPVRPAETYIVGEVGPEKFDATRPGWVIP